MRNLFILLIFFLLFFSHSKAGLKEPGNIKDCSVDTNHYLETLRWKAKAHAKKKKKKFFVVYGKCHSYGEYYETNNNLEKAHKEAFENCSKLSGPGICYLYSVNDQIIWNKYTKDEYLTKVEPELLNKKIKKKTANKIELKTNKKKYVFSKPFYTIFKSFKLKKEDPTLFKKLEYIKTTENNSLTGRMGCPFNNHKCSVIIKNYDAHIFLATYSSGKKIEFIVEDRYKKNKAEKLALKYATMIGQLPSFLIDGYCFKKINADLSIDGFSDPNCTKGINKIRIHKGVKFMFAEPKKNLFVIYPENLSKASQNIRWITLVHELAHVSLVSLLPKNTWGDLQFKDEYTHVTKYASTYVSEDLAETAVAWVALRCMNKTSKKHRKKILDGIPNRIKLFDNLKLNTAPMKCKY